MNEIPARVAGTIEAIDAAAHQQQELDTLTFKSADPNTLKQVSEWLTAGLEPTTALQLTHRLKSAYSALWTQLYQAHKQQPNPETTTAELDARRKAHAYETAAGILTKQLHLYP